MGINLNTRDVLGCCNGGNQALKWCAWGSGGVLVGGKGVCM